MKEYLSPKEAAGYTGISLAKLSKLRSEGRGCAYIRLGDSRTKAVVKYRRSDLDKWLSSNQIKTTGGL